MAEESKSAHIRAGDRQVTAVLDSARHFGKWEAVLGELTTRARTEVEEARGVPIVGISKDLTISVTTQLNGQESRLSVSMHPIDRDPFEEGPAFGQWGDTIFADELIPQSVEVYPLDRTKVRFIGLALCEYLPPCPGRDSFKFIDMLLRGIVPPLDDFRRGIAGIFSEILPELDHPYLWVWGEYDYRRRFEQHGIP